MPEKNEDFLGKFGWAAGWGALNPGSRLRPKTLQAVDVPVIENRVCERWHRANGINVVIYPEMLCAGYRNGIRIASENDENDCVDDWGNQIRDQVCFPFNCLIILLPIFSFQTFLPFHLMPLDDDAKGELESYSENHRRV